MKQPMKLIIRVLAVAAVIQLGLVGIAYMGGDKLQASQSNVALLNFKPDAVDAVTIYGPDKQLVKLHKSDSWKTDAGFPADSGKIGQLLQKLADLKHGLPVATSPSAWPRFKLVKDDFERHMMLSKAGKVVAELYLGKGAGARQSYVRGSHDQAAYSVALASYELPLDVSRWQDKTLLQIAAGQVNGLDVAGVQLTKAVSANQNNSAKQNKPVWHADPAPTGKQLDQHAVEQALHLLATLRFSKEIGKHAPAGYDFRHPALTLTVSYRGKQRRYRFFKTTGDHQKNGEQYLLKVSDRPEYFAVDAYNARLWLKKMNPAGWFVEPKAKTKPS